MKFKNCLFSSMAIAALLSAVVVSADETTSSSQASETSLSTTSQPESADLKITVSAEQTKFSNRVLIKGYFRDRVNEYGSKKFFIYGKFIDTMTGQVVGERTFLTDFEGEFAEEIRKDEIEFINGNTYQVQVETELINNKGEKAYGENTFVYNDSEAQSSIVAEVSTSSSHASSSLVKNTEQTPSQPEISSTVKEEVVAPSSSSSVSENQSSDKTSTSSSSASQLESSSTVKEEVVVPSSSSSVSESKSSDKPSTDSSSTSQPESSSLVKEEVVVASSSSNTSEMKSSATDKETKATTSSNQAESVSTAPASETSVKAEQVTTAVSSSQTNPTPKSHSPRKADKGFDVKRILPQTGEEQSLLALLGALLIAVTLVFARKRKATK